MSKQLVYAGIVPLLLVCVGAGSPIGGQEAYPSRQISLVVPNPPGGFMDVVARSLAEGLRETFKQGVVVLNRPGGNGKIATGEIVRSPSEGYSFLISNDGGMAINAAVDPQYPFDYEKDYSPVAELVKGRYVVLVRSTLPVTSMGELIAHARANPGKLTYGSAGLATVPHFAMEMLLRNTGTRMIHVPYQGAAPAVPAGVAGGHGFCPAL